MFERVSEQNTLNEIRERKKQALLKEWKVETKIHTSSVTLTDKEQDECFKEWLQQKRKELFIETVSTMDCELSGVREETFEALLEDLEK